MPPNVPESDNDLDSADKNSDENNKQKKDTCSNNDCISEQSNACSTMNFIFKHGEKVIMTMNREHSMFMNCIPLTWDMLGANVLAKILSVVRNGLFKSAKFYPNKNHAIQLWVCVCMIVISGLLALLATMKG